MPYRSQKTVLLLSVLLLVASACAGKSASGTPGNRFRKDTTGHLRGGQPYPPLLETW